MKEEKKLKLPTLDELFTTEEERRNSNLEKVININIENIDNFKNHPFKVVVNDDDELLNSIKEVGVTTPAIVRPKDNNRFELISGHRRKQSCEILGLETLPCVVRDLTDDEATILMVDCNYQREKILPSEKAFAYKLKMEALSHRGKRNDLTSSPLANKSTNGLTAQFIGEKFGDGKDNVYRYIRLTELIPEILNLVDEEKIALRPAVNISFLEKDEQEVLLDVMQYNDCTPSVSQSKEIRDLSKSKQFNEDKVMQILNEEKGNQVEKIHLNRNRFNKVLPKLEKSKVEDFIYQAIIHYNRFLERQSLIEKKKKLSEAVR